MGQGSTPEQWRHELSYVTKWGRKTLVKMKQKVAITAVGVVNALGTSLEEVRRRLFAGDQSGLVRSSEYLSGRECFVGAVLGELPGCPAGLEELWSRNAALSLAALKQIEGQLAAAIDRYGRHRIGVILGSSTSGISEGEVAVKARLEGNSLPSTYCYAQQQMGTVSIFLAKLLGITGPCYTISTACSSSSKVFRAARNAIRSGLADCIITGGFDSLCNLTVNGFSSLELVSDEVTNPFSANRKGITIGEGGAIFLLERAHSDAIEDEVLVAGAGESSDAYHISSPDPSGTGAASAMSQALCDAGVSAHDVTYINLHGTGTPHNDLMEAVAVRSLFSEQVPCSSTKPLVGHTLGASGAIEAAFSWMVLTDTDRRLPPHMFDGVSDPAMPALNLVSRDAVCSSDPRVVLSNSFGFGGSNCALVLTRGVA